MVNYKTMYNIVCEASSRAIDAPLKDAAGILQTALHQAEEIYLETCGEETGEHP